MYSIFDRFVPIPCSIHFWNVRSQHVIANTSLSNYYISHRCISILNTQCISYQDVWYLDVQRRYGSYPPPSPLAEYYYVIYVMTFEITIILFFYLVFTSSLSNIMYFYMDIHVAELIILLYRYLHVEYRMNIILKYEYCMSWSLFLLWISYMYIWWSTTLMNKSNNL